MSKKEHTPFQEDLELIHIKSLIETGTIKRMRDLKDSSSTKISKYAGINQGRYSSKLFTPGDFTESEICRIALVLDIDPELLSKIIINEIRKDSLDRVNGNIAKEQAKKRS